MNESFLSGQAREIIIKTGHNLSCCYWSRKIYLECSYRKEPFAVILKDILGAKKREVSAYVYLNKIMQRGPDKKFIIFATPRSGSNLLRDLLGSHPAVQCDGELLAYRAFSPRQLIRYQSVLSKKPVYGFKCFLHQCTYDQAIREPQRFISSLHAEGWKVIFLKRSNIVRQAISHFLARRAGAWNRCTSLPQHEYKKTFIKVSDFIRYMRLSETWQQDQIKIANAVPCITIEYEKDLLNQHCHQSAADNVFAYLGIASAPVHTSMRKQADTPLSELIGNYDQIYAVVKKAGYASCLDS